MHFPIPSAEDGKRLGHNITGAVMVEYMIVLTVVTVVAVIAMYEVGKPLVQFYMQARGVIVLPA
ncbi:MAG: hypothetical protein KC416_09375 [Myxococcales bacterium]|nr:hypothetical protein [Myxococcales bacterium]